MNFGRLSLASPLVSARARGANLRWLIVAALLGVASALLPPITSLTVIGIGALLVIGFVQPIALLLVMLLVAPLKTLIETEAHITLDPGQWALAFTVAVYLVNRIVIDLTPNPSPNSERGVGHVSRNMPASFMKRLPGRSGKAIFQWSAVYIPILTILLSASFSLFVAQAPGATITELAKWVEVLIVAVLVVSFCVEGHWAWVVVGLLAASAAQSLIGLYQFFGGSGAPHLWIIDYRFFRAFGTFGQPNPFGAFMGLALPLAIGLLFGYLPTLKPFLLRLLIRINRARFPLSDSPSPNSERGLGGEVNYLILLSLTVLILLAGLIASWSRGAWLGFGAALLMMLAFAPRRRWLGVVFAVGVVLLTVGLSSAGLLPSSLTSRLSDISQELVGLQDVRGQVIDDARYAVLERLAHWQAAIGMANDHPLLGVGFGNYEDAYPQYALLNWRIPLGHAHNYYLNVLAETGIIGLIGYVAAWLFIFALTVRLLAQTGGPQRGLVLGLLGVWTHLAVHSLFDKLYVNNLFLHIGAMLGLIGGLHLVSRSRISGLDEPT